ncbi:MAG: hypothetical protein NTZ05_15165, partial [Chloroflexi bacterium]|nr:hypothetical protein [Chloroflexota bacterium]
HSPNSAGAAVEWLAEGGDVTVQVAASPGGSRFYVTVDDEAANGDLDRDDWGRAALSTAAKAPEIRRVVLAHLTPGVHRLRLQAEQGGGDWGLDGVSVSAPSAPPWGLFLAAPLAGVGAMAVGFLLGRRHSLSLRRRPARRR